MGWSAIDCPFALNIERYSNDKGYDKWPGGFYIEVLVHADERHPFWESDLLVVVDFAPHRYEIREHACDENVDIFSRESPTSFTVEVKPMAAATINGPVGRFGCAINGLGTGEDIPPAKDIKRLCHEISPPRSIIPCLMWKRTLVVPAAA